MKTTEESCVLSQKFFQNTEIPSRLALELEELERSRRWRKEKLADKDFMNELMSQLRPVPWPDD